MLDALDRHDPTCPRAIRLGLSRLAEGEEPISPSDLEIEEQEPEPEPAVHGAPQEDIREYRDDGEQWVAQPRRMIRAQAAAAAIEQANALWIAYYGETDGAAFDVIVFGSEIEALRYAVKHGWSVRHLELDRSVREQAQDHA